MVWGKSRGRKGAVWRGGTRTSGGVDYGRVCCRADRFGAGSCSGSLGFSFFWEEGPGGSVNPDAEERPLGEAFVV